MIIRRKGKQEKIQEKLKPKIKIKKNKVLPFSNNYSGEYYKGFPFRPKILKKEVICDELSLKRMVDKLMVQPAFAFDTETNTLKVVSDDKNFRFVGISISWGENNNYYIPVGHLREEDIDGQLDLDIVVKYLKKVFERKDVLIFGWNIKFDFHTIARLGIKVKSRNIFDGMIASWLCDENSPNGLKENSITHLGISQTHYKEVTNSVPNDVKKKFGYASNSKVPFNLVLIDDAEKYVLDDSFFTWCNCIGYMKKLEEEKMDTIFYKMYMPFVFTIFDMEERGVSVDKEKLKQMGEEMQIDLDKLQYKIYELSGVEFNIGSSQQKAEILFGFTKEEKELELNKLPKYIQKAFNEKDYNLLKEKGYKVDGNKIYKLKDDKLLKYSFNFSVVGTTDRGNPSTDSDAIWKLSQKVYKDKRKQQGVEMCKLMSEYSVLSKLKTAFVDGILEQLYDDSKAHPNFNIIGTDSGRLSCSSPNLQQLPKAEEDSKYQIRSVFEGSIDEKTGKKKTIIAIDYHNLEMVCLTHFSKDKNLSEMFENDDDAHGSTAVNMFNLDCTPVEAKKNYPHLRQAAKTINFMLMYGGGATRLYETLRDDHFSPLDLGSKEYLKEYKCSDGVKVAQIFIDKYFESYSGVAEFIRKQKKNAKRNLFVRTVLGRKRRLPDINSRDGKISSYCERLAVNSAIQGTAGDITINAQLRIDKDPTLKELGCDMLLQIHDEIVLECPEENVDKAIPIIKYLMEHPFGDSEDRQIKYLRADWGIGKNYQQAK